MQKNNSILLLGTFFIVSSLFLNAAQPAADFSHSRKWENNKSQKQQTQAVAAAQTPSEIQQPVAGAHAVPLAAQQANQAADEKKSAELPKHSDPQKLQEVTVTNPLLLRGWLYSNGGIALAALDNLKEGEIIDASRNPDSAKNLIRGAEEFSERNDRDGMRKLVQKSKKHVANRQLKTNDTMRHIARDAVKAHLAQEREEVRAFLAAKHELTAKFLAAQHSDITQFLTQRHITAYRLKATEVDTYALGGVSENDDSDLESYDSVDKYTEKQRKNEKVEGIAAVLITQINKLRVDIDTIGITKATQKERTAINNRDTEPS